MTCQPEPAGVRNPVPVANQDIGRSFKFLESREK